MSPEDAVDNGVKFLDLVMPHWRSKVNWDRLNMQSPAECVLGQTLGYRTTLKAYGHDGGRWAEEHGFYSVAKGESTKAKYNELELLWRRHGQ